MKSATTLAGSWRWLAALGLWLAAAGLPSSRAADMSPYVATVAHASAGDRLQITALLAQVAGEYGMKKGETAEGLLAFFYAPPSGLGLSMSASDEQNDGTITIVVGESGPGIQLNAQRQAVIAAVDAGLRRAFGVRLKRPGKGG